METVGAAEALQALGAPVDAAEHGRTPDEFEGQVAARGQVGVERRLPATAHRAPAVDLGHHVERLAEDDAGVVGGDSSACGTSVPFRPRTRRISRSSPSSRAASARGPRHPQHHPVFTAPDPVERVLRTAGQQLQDGQLALAWRVMAVEPVAQRPGVDVTAGARAAVATNQSSSTP